MKFKYNRYEKKLWRVEDDYFYEVSEENRQIEHFVYIGSRISFKLGGNHYLFIITYPPSLKIIVCYAKPLKNGENAYYEKTINPGLFQIESTFEFSEVDRVEKLEKIKSHD